MISFSAAAPCSCWIRVEHWGVVVSAAFFCEAVLYSVFLIFTETTRIFCLNQGNCWMTKVTNTYFFACLGFFQCKHILQCSPIHNILGQKPLDKLYSAADQYSTMGLERLVRVLNIFSASWICHFTCNVFIYLYIHKLSYIQRKEVLMNLHQTCPQIKVKISIMKDVVRQWWQTLTPLKDSSQLSTDCQRSASLKIQCLSTKSSLCGQSAVAYWMHRINVSCGKSLSPIISVKGNSLENANSVVLPPR